MLIFYVKEGIKSHETLFFSLIQSGHLNHMFNVVGSLTDDSLPCFVLSKYRPRRLFHTHFYMEDRVELQNTLLLLCKTRHHSCLHFHLEQLLGHDLSTHRLPFCEHYGQLPRDLHTPWSSFEDSFFGLVSSDVPPSHLHDTLNTEHHCYRERCQVLPVFRIPLHGFCHLFQSQILFHYATEGCYADINSSLPHHRVRSGIWLQNLNRYFIDVRQYFMI